ncbi:MAG: tRNA (adenosine(37)-N6)-threonylcarbamoyltransferase complex ATPase subunit type 1 TsaE [Candidatus Muirbacterium halophilum]|nr:tRNA (adenosine(37)-N6)-threonylcarbamoyltransferase complex ATPase subunit type 1 TsaE [Candidatus Muirbacterium halophilum]MCK9477343.1 tRNA (adenosine(37)-N6)-threonylcarbamoyltransferase complex ATPase subunit type 1 TsaE [Candidatus Muirbacterium halophilum]
MKINNKKDGKEFFENFFREYSKKYKIFLFKGDLGSGKTFYISHIIGGFKKKQYINSPTYTIMNTYNDEKPYFFHADLYRLENVEDVFETGIVDLLNEDGFFLIEWPDRFLELFNNFPYVLIEITEGIHEEEREVKISENIIH